MEVLGIPLWLSGRDGKVLQNQDTGHLRHDDIAIDVARPSEADSQELFGMFVDVNSAIS